jgi:flagellar biosynthesis/type III secretory pathway protein FliH
MTLAVKQILAAPRIPDLGTRHGVVKGIELASASQADVIVGAARAEAETIVADARCRAQEWLDQARREAQDEREKLLARAEGEFWSRATEHQRELEQDMARFRSACEAKLLVVATRAIRALADEVPPKARVRTCVRALLREVAPPPEAALLVHEADMAAVKEWAPPLPWPVRADADIQRGDCRLTGRQGEWRSSFAGRLERLLDAMDRFGARSQQTDARAEGHAQDYLMK